jgi:hypothetical protein
MSSRPSLKATVMAAGLWAAFLASVWFYPMAIVFVIAAGAVLILTYVTAMVITETFNERR